VRCGHRRGPTTIAAGLLLLFPAAGAALFGSSCGTCHVSIHRTAITPIAGQTGSFDALEIDNAAHRLYIADRTDSGLDVFDISTSTARYKGTIYVDGLPNGLAIASDFKRLYAGLSNGTVVAIDTDPGSSTFYKVVSRITIGAPAADLLDYGAKRKRIYVGTGDAGFVASIDPADDQVLGHFVVGGSVEQPRFDPADGMVYVTSPDKDALFKIDPNDGQVKRTYKLGGCKPSGLAINPSKQLALIACARTVLRLELGSGSQHLVPSVLGGDIVTYDGVADMFMVASPHTTSPSMVGVFNGSGELVNKVTTNAQGHAAVYDEAHKVAYAPDAGDGKGQVVSFDPLACEPPPEWLNFLVGLSFWLLPLVVLGAALFLYGRSRARSRALANAKRQ